MHLQFSESNSQEQKQVERLYRTRLMSMQCEIFTYVYSGDILHSLGR